MSGRSMDVGKLAIFGADPLFSEKLHVGRPNIGDRERLFRRINELLDRRWLTNNGPLVHELEQKVASLLGVRHCIAMCNATVGLEIAIRAAGLQGEVIIPSFTFIATAHALQWQEITPVFCDVDPATHNLDPHQVEALITPRTTGILGVHVWGRPCAIDELQVIARRHDLKLLFDAAHAFGCSHGGRMIGNFGTAEIFSFHATKFFNTFEGGAITTNDDDLATRIRLMTNFGFAGYDQVIYLGTNGKMSEVSAAMGLTGLESLVDFIKINKRNYDLYRQELSRVPGIRMIQYDENEKNNYQYLIVEVDQEKAGLSRDQLVKILQAENILARRYFYPGCHQMEPYHSLFPEAGRRLPETEKLSLRAMSLPTGTAVTLQDIRAVCSLISRVVANAPEIQQRLREMEAVDLAEKAH
jgi:dTDP-4-amino-4,6-dideoxygalactose transaminase